MEKIAVQVPAWMPLTRYKRGAVVAISGVPCVQVSPPLGDDIDVSASALPTLRGHEQVIDGTCVWEPLILDGNALIRASRAGE